MDGSYWRAAIENPIYRNSGGVGCPGFEYRYLCSVVSIFESFQSRKFADQRNSADHCANGKLEQTD